jgi:structural maintenance of chromosome 3 (chondroitin sulfate proteoglycan 6)
LIISCLGRKIGGRRHASLGIVGGGRLQELTLLVLSSFVRRDNALSTNRGGSTANSHLAFSIHSHIASNPPTHNHTHSQEERQSLLHEGSGSAAVNSFVEIVFDNSDNRFSLENSDEVVLRRTIGHKKDEFFLQRKRATKNEIMSLLEGAGFSKSNPYFIVQQGKVNALCTMSDGERLQLLKEVAGTTVYDEKKEESLTKMEENAASIEKIDETLEYMDNRLEDLRGEKEELTQYQKLDRDRRAVEYTLYDKELRRAREALDEIEHQRNEAVDRLSELSEEARSMHERIMSVQANQKTKSNALRRNQVYLKG